MDSLLTLSITGYDSVELAMRLTVALTAMTAILLGFCITCVSSRYRLSLIISSVALLGASWFESGTWMAWKDAFELAGTSYSVTGHLLAGEERIVAWSLGVPAILFSFGLVRIYSGKTGGHLLELLFLVLLGLALLAPFSSLLALVLMLAACGLLCLPLLVSQKTGDLFIASCLSAGCILLPGVLLLGGFWHLIPLGNSAEEILVHGEIIHSLCDILSLVVPSLLLLIGVLKLSNQESVTKN